MPTIGVHATGADGPAGGVLSGTYPDPGFAQPMATVTQLADRAASVHEHATADVTSGTFPITRIPTGSSTASDSATVPLTNDTRLAATTPRPWAKYAEPVNSPSAGQYPGWSTIDSAYIPTTLTIPEANSAGRRGIITIGGDLGGTSTEQRIVRRGPFGGHIALPSSGSITIDASTGNSFSINAALNTTLAVPTNPVDGQRIYIEFYASGAARTITTSGTTTNASGTALPMSVAANKLGFLELAYSLRAGRWVVLYARAEP